MSRVVAVLLVLATGASLWVAGLAGGIPAEEHQALSAQQVTRSLNCVTGLPAGRAVVGALAGEVNGNRPVRRGVVDLGRPRSGFVLSAGVDASASAFASQDASSGPWYAAQPCAEPSRQHWFLGVGGSQLHQSTLSVVNPRSGEAVFDVRVFGPRGELDVPGLRGLSVRKTPLHLDLTRVAPSTDDLVVSVTAIRGLVSASLVDEWAPSASAKRLTEFVPAQADAGTDLVLGGLPEKPERATLSLFNTGENATVVDLRLVGEDGTFTAAKTRTVTAAPGQLVQVPVPSAGRQGASGVRLTSTEPVVAGLRSLAGRDVVRGPVLGALGESAVIGVPARAEGRLRLFNPDDAAAKTVRVEFFGADGSRLLQRNVQVTPGAAVAVAPKQLRAGAVRAIRITGGDEVRAVLEVSDGGAAAMPVSSVSGETRVPAVRAGS